MKILSVIYTNPDYYPPVINSAHVLSQAGHKQTIVSRLYKAPTGVIYPPDLEVIRVEPTTAHSLLEFLGFIQHVLGSSRYKRYKADVYIGHDAHGFLVARLLAWRDRRPLVYHCHDFTDVPKTFGARLVSWFERLFARTADLMIVPDAERGKVISERLHLKRPPVIAANTPLYVPDQSEGILKTTLREMGYCFEKIVLRQGRIDEGHCIDVTVRSIPFWKNPQWGFVIVGVTNEPYKAYLLKLASELGVLDRFVILPPVRYPNVLKYTIEADIGHAMYAPTNFNHTYSNTASNKLMEYMACGIPVILTHRAHHQQFLDQYQVGVTADMEDPESIAEAVNFLLGNPEIAMQMGMVGRKTFAEHFCYNLQYHPVLAYLHSLSIMPE